MTRRHIITSSLQDIANRLGLGKRMSGEIQVLAQGFRAVDLEGLGPFQNKVPRFTPETEERIRTNWESIAATNLTMFAGPLATVKDFVMDAGILKFQLQRSRFDIYDALKQRMPSQLNLTHKPLDRGLCLPLSMGAVTLTAPDVANPKGTIVFGIRSKLTAFGTGNSTTLPSGYFNPDTDRLQIDEPKLPKSLLSIRFTTVKELAEELNIVDYRTFEYLGLVYDRVLAKGLLVAIRLSLDLTRSEVEGIAKNVDTEVQRFHFVTNDIEAVRLFIQKHPPTPHDIAKLVLHFAAS